LQGERGIIILMRRKRALRLKILDEMYKGMKYIAMRKKGNKRKR